MILATLLTWTLLGQSTGGFAGPSAAGRPAEGLAAHLLDASPRGPIADARAHPLVVAEVTAGTAGGADGAVLRVASALKGDAAAVDGRRLGFAAGLGRLDPAAGRPYLVAVGRDQDRDVILDVRPATATAVQAASRAEDNRRAIRAGVARRVPGAALSVAEAAARAHTVVVGEVVMHAEVGAGGLAGAASTLRVATTLKGAARPGEWIGAGYQPPDHGIAPQIGESFLAFLGKADARDVDVALKLVPATPVNIQEARDQVRAAGPAGASR